VCQVGGGDAVSGEVEEAYGATGGVERFGCGDARGGGRVGGGGVQEGGNVDYWEWGHFVGYKGRDGIGAGEGLSILF
jgi:hypothetical protein